MPLSVFILGSCVTRDALWAAQGHEVTHADYFARTSCATAFSDRPFALQIEDIDRHYTFGSAFRRRMVERDVSRALVPALCRPIYDALLVDFIDDRFSFIEIDGTIALSSAEFQETGLHRDPRASVISPLSERHFQLWRGGVYQLASLMADLDIPVIVNAAVITKIDTTGAALPNTGWVDEHNELLQRRYRICGDLGFHIVSPPADAIVADPEHKWGRAAFHYAQPFYQHFVARVDEIMTRRRH